MAAAEADPVSGGIQHADRHIDALSKNIQLVPEDVLMDLRKTGDLKDFTQNCENENQVNRVWESLFLTFSTRTIPQGHTQLAGNAVTVFVQNALSSKVPTTQRLASSHKTWLAVFEVILDRFMDGSPRVMKQVLSTLVKTLKAHPDVDEARLILLGIRDAVLPSIILADPRSRMKASLAALDRLVVENGLSPSKLMSLVYDWLVAHYDKWRPLFAEYCQSLSTDISPFSGTNVNYDNADINVKHSVPIIFNLALLMHTAPQGHAAAVGLLMAALHAKANKTEEQSCYPLSSWTLPTKYAMLQMIDYPDTSRSILNSLLGSDIKGFRAFIAELPLETVLSGDMRSEGATDEFLLLFSALEIGKKAGFVYEDYIEESKAASKARAHALVLNSELIGRFLLHNEATIRLSALSLLIATHTSTKPISAAALKLILSALPCLHAESDAQFRQETQALITRLMLRLRGPNSQKDFMEKEGKDAKIFMENYINFLEEELTSTASYQRHISALKSVSTVLNSGVDPNATHVPQKEQILWRYKIHVLRPNLFRLLVDLLLSPFEDIRGSALNILNLFPNNISIDRPEDKIFNTRELLITALSRAEELASKTSRADHADTVARLYHVLFFMADQANGATNGNSWFSTKLGVVDEILQRLEKKLFHEAGLFHVSLQDAPLHGHTSALRYIVATPAFHATVSNPAEKDDQTWRKVHDRIIAVCERTWTSVKPVLCVDSPEGHTNELVDDFMVGPKDLLSYSWRALKDSSLLLHAILSNKTYALRDRERGLKRADYETIGGLSFVQLSQLRHRGAFSSVSLTFETCCVRCAENEDLEISSLPDMWYQESLKLIQHQASKLTRRSAGLPATILGISIAKSSSPLFEKIMSDLQEISNSPAVQAVSYNELSLPQVHAMNCLNNIIMHTKLASSTEGYIMSTLKLATDCLSSPIWAIRNCGLMLLHSLMNRVCKRNVRTKFGFSGASGAESNMTITFEKYAGLTQLMAQLLTDADEARASSKDNRPEKGTLASAETEKVFPALGILAEKVPSTADDDDALLRELVLRHVKSTIWAVRDQSARVYASLLRPNEMLPSVNVLLNSDVSRLSQIHMHGKLLCIRFALLRIWHSDYWRDNFDGILVTARKAFDAFFPHIRSPYARTTLFDILSDALESIINCDNEVIIKTLSFVSEIFDAYGLEHALAELVSTGPEDQNRTNAMRAESLLRRSLAWCVILKNLLSLTISELESSPTKLIGPFFDLSTGDSDAACWILERIRILFSGYEKQKDFLSLYLLILLQGFHEENVKANTALNLAEILEDALEKDVKVDFLDKWARVSDHLFIQSQENIWSRELTENVLRLQGSLLTLKYLYAEGADLANESIDIRRWAVSIRSALSEETVFSARFSAIMSLKTFSRILRRPNQAPDTSLVSLELYVMLYDMLNDDDDELRTLAAHITSWVLSYSTLFPNQTASLSAVPAAKSLAEFIAVTYSSQAALFQQCVGRLMRQAFRHQQHKKPDFIPFKALFEDYCKESTALFEVEKQNLFIDDVREIDIWTKLFRQLGKSVHDKNTVSKLAEWVSGGLEYLSIKMDSQEDNVLGWTSKPEIYTLGALLFNVASVLIFFSTEPEVEVDNTISSAALKEKLKAINERGQSISLHPDWLNRIQAAISAGGENR